MPRIDNYDLYDYTYNHNSKLYTFIFIIIAGLIIYFGILGLFNSRNKMQLYKEFCIRDFINHIQFNNINNFWLISLVY